MFAAGLGLVAGPVLAAVQVRVLRHHAPRARRWLLANALGWAAGMPLVFVAVGQLARSGPTPRTLSRAAAALLAAGAAVGLIEGLFLARLLRPGERALPPANA